MSIYISTFIFFLFGILKNEIIKTKKTIFPILIIIFLFSFTYQMGTDWISYQNYYENIISRYNYKNIFSTENEFEIGYILLNLFFYKLGFKYEIFNGIILGMCTFILFKFIQKKSQNQYIAYFVLIFPFFLSVFIEPLIRQYIALSFFLISIRYIERKKIFKYTFFIFLAAQFHKSAYFLLIFYFIESFEITFKKLLVLILLIKGILEILFKLLLFNFTRYYNYLYKSTRYMEKQKISLINIGVVCVYLLILYFIYLPLKQKEKKIFNFSVIFILTYFLSNYFPILSRMNIYFVPFFSIVLSNIGEVNIQFHKNKRVYRNKLKKIIAATLIFFMYVLIFYRRIESSELYRFAYLNYKNYFIEFMKGNLNKNFEEKSEKYKEKVKLLMENKE